MSDSILQDFASPGKTCDLTKSSSAAQTLLSKSLEDLALEEEDNHPTAATSQSKQKVDKVTQSRSCSKEVKIQRSKHRGGSS